MKYPTVNQWIIYTNSVPTNIVCGICNVAIKPIYNDKGYLIHPSYWFDCFYIDEIFTRIFFCSMEHSLYFNSSNRVIIENYSRKKITEEHFNSIILEYNHDKTDPTKL